MATGSSDISARIKDVKPTKNDKKRSHGDKGDKNTLSIRDDDDTCVDCGKAVNNNQQGLKCDGCGFWHHTVCETVSDETYAFLCQHDDEATIVWYCKKCAITCKSLMAMMLSVHDKLQQLDDSMYGIASTINTKMDDLYAEMCSRLDTKANHDVVAVEEVQKKVDDNMVTLTDSIVRTVSSKVDDLSTAVCSRLESKVNCNVVAVEEMQKKVDAKMDDLADFVKNREKIDEWKKMEVKVDTIIDTVKDQAKIDTHFVHDCVEDAIMVKFAKDQEEMEDVKRRRLNVIVHGLTEPAEEDDEARKSRDEDEIVSMLHEINCDDVSVTSSTRLGRKSDSTATKPRPMKLVIASEEQKEKVLRLAKNLKRKKEKGLDNVFIHQDLTPLQREKRRKLIQELRERQEQGERNLIIVRGKIVTKRTWLETATSD